MGPELSRDSVHHRTIYASIEAFNSTADVRWHRRQRTIDHGYPLHYFVCQQRTHDSQTESAGAACHITLFIPSPWPSLISRGQAYTVSVALNKREAGHRPVTLVRSA